VVCWQPRLTLVAMRCSHDVPPPPSEPPAFPSSWLVAVVALWGRCLRLILPPLEPSFTLWMATSDDISLPLIGVTSLLPWAG
jgi:hypothetical protein